MGSGTEIGKVRGHGAAGHGGDHWIMQRVTALGNIVLTIWFAISLILLPSFEYETLSAWLAQASVAVPMALLIFCVFKHVRLGLQVLIEDYVPDAGLKFGAIMLLNFYVMGAGALGLFAIAKIAFTGADA